MPNRTIVIRASKSGGFRENREGWQPCIMQQSHGLLAIAKLLVDIHIDFMHTFATNSHICCLKLALADTCNNTS